MVKLLSIPFKIRNKLIKPNIIIVFNIILMILISKIKKNKLKAYKLERKE